MALLMASKITWLVRVHFCFDLFRAVVYKVNVALMIPAEEANKHDKIIKCIVHLKDIYLVNTKYYSYLQSSTYYLI